MLKKSRLSRTSIYVIVICVFLLAVNALLGFALTQQSRDALITMIHSRMLDVSNTAAAMIDGDILESIQAEDKNTPEYQAVLKTLSYFKNNIDLEFIYCIRDMGGKNFVFTIDPAENPGEFGTPIVYTDALYRASLGTPSVDNEPYTDSWGRFYSAYSPVFNSHQKVAGIVAVDFSADWYDQQLSRSFVTTLVILIASLFFGTIIVILLTSSARRRYRMIYSELNGISDGIETLVHEATASSKAKLIQMEGLTTDQSRDEITAIGDKIRSLQNTLSEQIGVVRSQTYLDGLTGLENRMSYLEEIKALETQIAEGTASFTVAMFDLNGLKRINDTGGHEKGDLAIAEAGAVLKKTFPDGRLFRIGGDEYVAILNKTDAEMRELFAQFDKNLAERNEKNPDLQIAMSKGYAVYAPETDHQCRTVFNRADDAMYADKSAYYMKQVNSLISVIKTSGSNKGAMDVEYRQFATMYEYIENIKKRFSHPFGLVTITLEPLGEAASRPETLEKAMHDMEQSIQQTIRNVDVTTRCSRQQFLIILLGSSAEGVKIAMDRIIEGFYGLNGRELFLPSYEVVELDE